MSDSDSEHDPSSFFNNVFKKEIEIKVDGNKIYFYKSITRDNILNLNMLLSEKSSKIVELCSKLGIVDYPPIYLFINSEGGDCFAGLSGADHIKNLEVPVYTVIDGITASAATFLSLAGKKRFVQKYSWVLVHQIRTWFSGTYEELKDEMQNSERIMGILRTMYLENTKIGKKIDTFFKHDLYIDSAEVIKLGIADEIYDGKNNKKRKYSKE